MDDLSLKETLVRRRDIFAGRIFTLHVDTVRLPDGTEALREVAEHPGGAAVLALDDAGQALVVEQYRHVFGRVLTEIPAGKLDAGETPAQGALRELREETGAVPRELLSLGSLLPSPGCLGEVLHLFLARHLDMGPRQPDAGEFLTVRRVPFPELVRQCLAGEIQDAKTVAAALRAQALLAERAAGQYI